MKKRLFVLTVLAALLPQVLAGCSGSKPAVVCTLFPQYDFVRAIAGDKMDAVLLLEEGETGHGFEPDAGDKRKIRNADLFIYTSDVMEPWAAAVIDDIGRSKINAVAAFSGVSVEYYHAEGENGEETLAPDPHAWVSPDNAVTAVESITQALCKIDSANAAFYRKNADEYILKLQVLDRGFLDAVKSGKRKTVVFADGFACRYFVKHYALGFLAAGAACAGDGTQTLTPDTEQIITAINTQHYPVVFYNEFSDRKTADEISEATGAQELLFHTCHNVTESELENGETYLSLTEKNLENLKTALG